MSDIILSIENLSFSYKKKVKREIKETNIFTDLSFTLNKGETNVIMGESGSGKTTLLSLIVGILYPDSGKVILNGEDITDLTIQSREIAYIYQKPVLYPHLTIYQNLMMGLNGYKLDDEEKDLLIKKMLKDIRLTSKLNFKPRHLSGGEQQLVAIAKAMIREPKLLLLDEPFSSLDKENKRNSLNLLEQLRKEHNTTILLSTNRFNEGSNFDRILLLNNGKIYFDGSPLEMVKGADPLIKGFID